MAWLDKRKRADGTYRYRIRDRINGEIQTVVENAGFWLGIANKRLEQYEKEKAGQPAPVEEKEIDAALEEMLKAKRREPHTVYMYRLAVAAYREHSKHRLVKEISDKALDAWRAAMETGELVYSRKEDGSNPRQYSWTSAEMYLDRMKAFCRFCFRRAWLAKNPADTLEIQEEPEATRRFLTRGEAAQLLRACRVTVLQATGGRAVPEDRRRAIVQYGLRHPEQGNKAAAKALGLSGQMVWWTWKRHGMAGRRARRRLAASGLFPVPIQKVVRNRRANNRLRRIVQFGLYTGMREGEVRNATLAHVTVLPPAPGSTRPMYVLFIPRAKRRKQRTVAIPWKIVRTNGFQKRLAAGDRGLLFPGWSKSGLSQARLRAVRRARLGRVRYHDLRHTFIRNYLLSKAGDTARLQKQTGHSRMAGLQPYLHFQVGEVAETIDRVEPK